MKYLAVFNTEPNLTYYTYVGLAQKDTAVIKFYAVSTAENADFKNIYTEIANSVSVASQETVASDDGAATETEISTDNAVETEAIQN